jgi:hypothetical protein
MSRHQFEYLLDLSVDKGLYSKKNIFDFYFIKMDNFYNMAKIAVLFVPKKCFGKMS